MTRTARFRHQHDELEDWAAALLEAAGSVGSAGDAHRARNLLNELTGVLVVHLSMEDKALYPRLMKVKSLDVVAVAKTFIEEMDELAEAFSRYNDRWADEDTINADPAGFAEETNAVVGALTNRIRRENHELYPLVDAC